MKRLRYAVIGMVGRWLANILLFTVRFETEHRERFDGAMAAGEGVIFAIWHGRLLPLTYYHRKRNIAALISRSGDGEYISRLVRGWGYEPVRGSSSRGGDEALRVLVRQAREGRAFAITPDGPRGPRQQLKPGVVRIAQLSGAPILPIAAGCRRAWWPGRWDRFCVPKPFARVRVVYGEPRYVPRDADEGTFQRCIEELEQDMNAMIEELDRDGGPQR